MRVRLLFSQGANEARFVELAVLPRIAELMESPAYGLCEIVNVIHSPDSPQQQATVVLRPAQNPANAK